MFDEYTPVPAIDCPRCGKQLSGWQGKDGPNLLLKWRQGQAKPTNAADDEWPRRELVEAARLPPVFSFYTECSCGHRVDATGSPVFRSTSASARTGRKRSSQRTSTRKST
jgi:hypothetical protein